MQKSTKAAINASALLLPTPSPSQVGESRRQAGLTQAAMAAALGLSGAARIGEYEAGRRTMPAIVWSFWLIMAGQHPHKYVHKN